MKERLQHLLHPLNLWCLFGGNFTTIFRTYEKYCWQPFLRHLLNNKFKQWVIDSRSYTCEQCESALGKAKPSVIFWAYTELYYFCSLLCRDKWLKPTVPDCKSKQAIEIATTSTAS